MLTCAAAAAAAAVVSEGLRRWAHRASGTDAVEATTLADDVAAF